MNSNSYPSPIAQSTKPLNGRYLGQVSTGAKIEISIGSSNAETGTVSGAYQNSMWDVSRWTPISQSSSGRFQLLSQGNNSTFTFQFGAYYAGLDSATGNEISFQDTWNGVYENGKLFLVGTLSSIRSLEEGYMSDVIAIGACKSDKLEVVEMQLQE